MRTTGLPMLPACRARPAADDFGGVFGGPILKDRTFFFFSYEGLRVRLPASFSRRVPSRSARQAATGVSQQILNAFPLPNGPENPATMLAFLVGELCGRGFFGQRQHPRRQHGEPKAGGVWPLF